MGIMKNVKDLFYLLISIEVILLITIKVWVMEKWSHDPQDIILCKESVSIRSFSGYRNGVK